MNWIWVAVGSAIGGVSRYLMAGAIWAATGPRFPWATLLVNVLGSFLIGIAAVMLATRSNELWPAREFLIIGILGGFTTFSSFSYDSLRLMQSGFMVSALGYILASVVVCIACTAMGAWLAQRFT
jgi:fluoride exporter